jgi:sialate O-acetylesterase
MRRIVGTLVVMLLALLSAAPAPAKVRLPHVFANDMVLQREMAIPVWGWASPGEKVTVKLNDQEVSATANAAGKWNVKLPAMSAGGPHQLLVSGENTITLTGVLIGEVWICSGQSNMEMGVGMCKNAQQEIAAANHPQIRLCVVPKAIAGTPQDDANAVWRVCSPSTITQGPWGGFSAAAYYFGRDLQQKLDVPVGVIETCWGGTRIEPWTPAGAFSHFPALKPIAAQVHNAHEQYARDVKAHGATKAVHPLRNVQDPTVLYNAMIRPLVPFAIRGAIWYQGESNHVEGMLYLEKMKALIAGWRHVWGQGDFPFYYVQLAPFAYNENPPTKLPECWQAQLESLKIPNTGMAITTDIATVRDIHPPNKQDVGHRLALWALANTYGVKDLVYSGPLFKAAAVEDGKIRVTFEHVGGGLASRDGKDLSHFEVAGADGKFVPAKAQIDGAAVVVASDKVAAPKYVRFGWHQLAEPNLMNKEGLPASPFASK